MYTSVCCRKTYGLFYENSEKGLHFLQSSGYDLDSSQLSVLFCMTITLLCSGACSQNMFLYYIHMKYPFFFASVRNAVFDYSLVMQADSQYTVLITCQLILLRILLTLPHKAKMSHKFRNYRNKPSLFQRNLIAYLNSNKNTISHAMAQVVKLPASDSGGPGSTPRMSSQKSCLMCELRCCRFVVVRRR
jgi:hypothetical protein